MALLRVLIYGHILIAASVAAFVWVTYLQLGIKPNYYLIAFTGVSTIATYNFQRVVRLRISFKSSPLMDWIKANRLLISILVFLCGVTIIFCITQLSPIVITGAGILGVISILYAVPLFKGKGLRDLPFLKIHLIALTWALTSLLPLLDHSVSIQLALNLFVEKYAFILAITIPFDIRDLPYDLDEKRTIPQVLGISTSKALAIILLFVSMIVAWNYNNTPLETSVFTGMISGVLILGSTTKRPEMYFTGLIDSTPLLYAILWFTFSNA